MEKHFSERPMIVTPKAKVKKAKNIAIHAYILTKFLRKLYSTDREESPPRSRPAQNDPCTI